MPKYDTVMCCIARFRLLWSTPDYAKHHGLDRETQKAEPCLDHQSSPSITPPPPPNASCSGCTARTGHIIRNPHDLGHIHDRTPDIHRDIVAEPRPAPVRRKQEASSNIIRRLAAGATAVTPDDGHPLSLAAIHKRMRVQDIPRKRLARLSRPAAVLQGTTPFVPARDGAEPAAGRLPVAVGAVDKVVQRVAVAAAAAVDG